MKLIRYFFVGGTAAMVDFAIFAMLIKLAGLDWFWAAAISFVVATGVNYFLSIRHVFESGIRFARHQEVTLIFLVSGIGLAINQGVLFLLIGRFGLNALLAKVFATGVVFVWNFLARSRFVFLARD